VGTIDAVRKEIADRNLCRRLLLFSAAAAMLIIIINRIDDCSGRAACDHRAAHGETNRNKQPTVELQGTRTSLLELLLF